MASPDSNELEPSAPENETEHPPEIYVTATATSEAIEENFKVEYYLEQASLRCTDPILIIFASYCIVIPMSELPNRKLLCHLQIQSPPQKEWFNVFFCGVYEG
jgi:hypothetical protein